MKLSNLPTAKCILEPRGDSGLEGYNLGDTYHYQLMPKDKDGKPYARVWPVSGDFYYETCSVSSFNKFFEEVKPGSVSRGISRTQKAIEWIAINPTTSPRAAALKFGVSPTAAYSAIRRATNKQTCKCCGQVIKNSTSKGATP
jgi:hypothetical protein